MSMQPAPLPLARRRRARPTKDPDKHPLLLGTRVIDGLGLLHQIAYREKELEHAIDDGTASHENRDLVDRLAQVSGILWAAVPQPLRREEHPSLYGALEEYQILLLQVHRSIMQSDAEMLHTVVRDLDENLPYLEDTFKATFAPPPQPHAPASVQIASSHMFQNASGFVISGGQFTTVTQNLPDHGSHEQTDKILRRLNGLIAIVLF